MSIALMLLGPRADGRMQIYKSPIGDYSSI